MHAIILAAGFGTRVSSAPVTNKAMINVGNTVAINLVLNSLNIEAVTTVHVAHNHSMRRKFRDWKATLKAPGKDARIPYVRLFNDGARSPDQASGAMGTLCATVKDRSLRGPLIVTPVDTIFDYQVNELYDGYERVCTLSAVRKPESVARNYGTMRINFHGRVEEFYEKAENGPTLCWIGPAYLSKEAVAAIPEYVAHCESSGVRPDDLGDYIRWLITEKQEPVVARQFEETKVWDISKQHDRRRFRKGG